MSNLIYNVDVNAPNFWRHGKLASLRECVSIGLQKREPSDSNRKPQHLSISGPSIPVLGAWPDGLGADVVVAPTRRPILEAVRQRDG